MTTFLVIRKDREPVGVEAPQIPVAGDHISLDNDTYKVDRVLYGTAPAGTSFYQTADVRVFVKKSSVIL